MFTDERLSRLRRLGRYTLFLLQGLALALWVEGLVTMKWQYRGCFVPVYGWPLPNRRFSEVSSLEYAVDWQAYAFDLAIYATIILVALVALRFLLRGHWKFVSVVLTVMVVFTPLKLLAMSL